MNIREYIDTPDQELRTDYEEHIFDKVFCCFLDTLPLNPKPPIEVDVWTDGTEILCRTEELARMIADALDAVTGEAESHYSYYDPEEDERDGCVDDHTGWWYVDFD